MKIVMIGTGYVGLVSGICFAEMGHEVVCVDKDASKINALNSGQVPIYEPGLEDLLARNMTAGRLYFTTDLGAAAPGAEAAFIAVGTPERKEDGAADLSFVYAAARELSRVMDEGTVVVTKSTVPVGTNRQVARIVMGVRGADRVDVASNPEFLRESVAISDFMKPDRVVVGTETARARDLMAEIYQPLSRQGFPVITTDLESAEIIKYAANAFLATKITFINEIARLCEKVGADVERVSEGMGLDTRIGKKFLKAGPGYGGSCFPKDTSALARTAQDAGAPMALVESVIEANIRRKADMVEKITALLDGDLSGKRIAVLGVTFKPETDDMREAPSLAILPPLTAAGAELVIVDPQGRREGLRAFPGADWADDAYEAAADGDLVILLTEWDDFRNLDLERLAQVMKEPHFADFRNVYDATAARSAGFTAYASVGHPDFKI